MLERFRAGTLSVPPGYGGCLSSPGRKAARVERKGTPFRKRWAVIMHDAWEIKKGVALYAVIGIAMGAAVHGYVPRDFLKRP